jgi:hypothetical protein
MFSLDIITVSSSRIISPLALIAWPGEEKPGIPFFPFVPVSVLYIPKK